MEYRILGPVEVVADGSHVDVGGPMERTLLARLLLPPGHAVSPSTLIDDLWEGEPPDTAAASLRVRVSKLRKALAGAGASDVLRREPSGYVLRLSETDKVDAFAFESQLQEGRAALKAGSPATATGLLDAALSCWRGPALADVATAPFARVEVARLEEEHLAGMGDRVDARLALGEHAEVLPELDALCARNPLHERLWAQLMIALYRCDRQADALAAYRRLQDVLRDEVGIGPSAQLVDLERRILKQAPDLTAPALPPMLPLPSGQAPSVVTGLPEPLKALIGSPFVGRATAVAQLRDALTAARAGSLRCTLLSGEPGIGKTRLAAEFAAEAQRDGVSVLYGRCDEDAVVPYQPFVEALRRWVARLSDEERAAIPSAERLAHLVPELGDLAGGRSRDEAELERYRLYEAVASALVHAARSTSVLFVIDDLHWADRPTVQLLRHIVRTRAAAPLFILGSYRDTDLGRDQPLAAALVELPREHGFATFNVRGLHESDIAQLFERSVEHGIGRKGLELARALAEITNGNPFYIEQVISSLVDTGTLVQRAGRTTVDGAVAALMIPDGVTATVKRRLARLSRRCHDALNAATVVGREFELDVVARMMEWTPELVLEPIEEALDAGLVREVPGSGVRPRYSFVHALVQQALYTSLSLARRRHLQVHAASAIEQEYATDLDAHVATIARHLRAAGTAADRAKTVDYSIRAMRRARRVFAFEEAIHHGETALELADSAALDAGNHARLLESLGDLMYVAGLEYERGVARLNDALHRYEALGDVVAVARVHAKLGRAYVTFWGYMDIPKASHHIHEAERLVGTIADARVQAHLMFIKIMAVVFTEGEDAGDELALRAQEIGRELDDEGIYAIATSFHAWCLMMRGQRDEARALSDESWTAGDRIDSGATFTASWAVGQCLLYSDARDCYRVLRRELDSPRRLQPSNQRTALLACTLDALLMAGDLEGAAQLRSDMDTSVAALYPLPEIRFHFFSGDWDRAREMVEACIASYQERRNQWMVTWAMHLLADILYAQGSLHDARTVLEESARTAQPVGWWGDFGVVSRLRLAEVEARLGNPDAAEEHACGTASYLESGTGARGLNGWLQRALGVIASERGSHPEADARFAEAAQTLGHVGFPLEQAETLYAWARSRQQSGDRRGAAQKFEAALGIHRRLGARGAWETRITRAASEVASRPAL